MESLRSSSFERTLFYLFYIEFKVKVLLTYIMCTCLYLSMATARVACGYATTVTTTTTVGQSIKTQSIPLLRIILHLLHIYLGALHTHINI